MKIRLEEINPFNQLLWRYRFILLAVPLLVTAVAYLIVSQIPESYVSTTHIAINEIDEPDGKGLVEQRDSRQALRVGNLMEDLKSRNLIDLVSYQLILTELSDAYPFRGHSVLKNNNISDQTLQRAVQLYRKKYENEEALNSSDPNQAVLLKILKLMKFDSETILSQLEVRNPNNSSRVEIRYRSQNPKESAFVVNTLSREYIKEYSETLNESHQAAIQFLKEILQEKADSLSRRINELGDYKLRHEIVNPASQSAQVLDEAAAYRLQLQEAEQTLASTKSLLSTINNRIQSIDRVDLSPEIDDLNDRLVDTRQKLHTLLLSYQNSDYDEIYKQPIDSLQAEMTVLIRSLNEDTRTALSQQQDLEMRKAELQEDYNSALRNYNTLQNRIRNLESKFKSLLPHEAVITAMERNIDIAGREHADLLSQYNTIIMQSQAPSRIKQDQPAMPGVADEKTKWMIVAGSGIASLLLCILVITIMYLADRRIRKPYGLALATQAPVLGYLNLVQRSTLDLQEIWKNINGTAEMQEFKKQLRSTRFEVNKGLALKSDRGQILTITSLGEGEGKTLVSACIAYTYLMVSKKVLLIDGNFDNPTLSKNSKTKLFLEDFLVNGKLVNASRSSGIMVMGNKGGDNTLLELMDDETIETRMEELRSQFDVIIVEAPGLNSLNKAKEWVMCSDKTVAVFEANQSLNRSKKEQIHYLNSINGRFMGWVLNKVTETGKSGQTEDETTFSVIPQNA